MTKQALKGITMLVIIISLAFITAVVTANAQSTSRLKAQVPFEFMVGDQKLPAGTYNISPLLGQTDAGIILKNAKSSAAAMRLTTNIVGRAPQTKLVFHKYANRYYLAEVWDATEVGRQLRTSTSEKAMERELARNNSEPETVTIIASLR
ncbi:MAG: hypothetical protein QOD00_485 [Blastocatellia bacterium]|jgi:hypothetical protein|nr:hypothetical protein [Blastocatellia bacterium]